MYIYIFIYIQNEYCVVLCCVVYMVFAVAKFTSVEWMLCCVSVCVRV